MAKTPSEFPSDWHYEQRLNDLARELAGRQNRLAELHAMPGAEEGVIAQTEAEIAAVKAELARYTTGQKRASKRPAKAAASR